MYIDIFVLITVLYVEIKMERFQDKAVDESSNRFNVIPQAQAIKWLANNRYQKLFIPHIKINIDMSITPSSSHYQLK